jgi:hypothetical protein
VTVATYRHFLAGEWGNAADGSAAVGLVAGRADPSTDRSVR